MQRNAAQRSATQRNAAPRSTTQHHTAQPQQTQVGDAYDELECERELRVLQVALELVGQRLSVALELRALRLATRLAQPIAL
jgi:hypothetical protein